MIVLVVAAHPDDEVLGCGGTMARLAAEGDEVHVLIVGEGATSRWAERGTADPSAVQALRDQAARAGALLGVRDVVVHGMPDNRLDAVPLLEVIKVVEAAIERVRPDVVYTHHGADLNVDHVVVNRAVLAATRPIGAKPVRDVLTFEVPSSTEWSFQRVGAFSPNVFVDISATLELKLRAVACYESEARDFPHPRSAKALEAIATRWGSVAGCGSAEAFELVRSIRLLDGR
jgi:LmbE family N-acetylglucosaminyl deacetylase